jgi:hypothetical protein
MGGSNLNFENYFKEDFLQSTNGTPILSLTMEYKVFFVNRKISDKAVYNGWMGEIFAAAKGRSGSAESLDLA